VEYHYPYFYFWCSIREFSCEELGDWLTLQVPTLRKIASGEKQSQRHEAQCNGPPKRRAALFWQSASMKVITTEQQEFLGKELLKIFCPNNMKVKVLFSSE